MYDEDNSEDGPRGTFESYKAEGDILYTRGAYSKAIEAFTTALEARPTDKNCLVARSKCYLQLGDTTKSLDDANASLSGDKDFPLGLLQKSEALYSMGDFERALMFYHRGGKLRPELQEFRLGIQKAREAIDNSVGSPSKVKLSKQGDLSFFAKQDEMKVPKIKKGATYSKPAAKTQAVTKREAPKSSTSEKTVKQLLGEMYGDKEYLEKLLKETMPTRSDAGRVIYDLVMEGLHYLDTRTDFWRQQRPMYARKRDRMEQRKARSGTAGSVKSNDNQYVIKELVKIDDAQAKNKYEESLKMAQKCMKRVESWTDDAITNRPEVMANLYSAMGNAYLEMAQYDNSLKNHQKDLDIANKINSTDAKSRALDNLGRVYARSGQFQKAIEVWGDKLPLSKSALESTWLFHEIGRCYLELSKFEEAKDYGDKSTAAAEEAKDDVWKLNASVLIAQAEVKLGELQSAVTSFEKSLEMAKNQGDKAAESAIKKALEDVNAKIVQGVRGDTEIDDDKEKDADEAQTKDETDAKEDTAEQEVEVPVAAEEENPTQEEETVEEEVDEESKGRQVEELD